MIQKLQLEDLPELADLIATEAGPEMRYPDAIDPVWLAECLRKYQESGIGICFISRDVIGKITGWLIGIQAPSLYSGKPTAIEQFWYVRSKTGSITAMRLFEEFIAEAKKRGCVRIMVGDWNPRGDRDLSGIYERYGFQPYERFFVKEA